MKHTGLTKEEICGLIADRVLNMAGGSARYDAQTYTLIVEPEEKSTSWLLLSVEVECELPPS